MRNKLKLRIILLFKGLQLPEDYKNLEFNKYKLKNNELELYLNDELINKIWYWDKNKSEEKNYKNGKINGYIYSWYGSGNLRYKYNYKNGIEI